MYSCEMNISVRKRRMSKQHSENLWCNRKPRIDNKLNKLPTHLHMA